MDETFDEVVVGTDLPLVLVRRGKVRDVYADEVAGGVGSGGGGANLAIVATDRISAFDVVMRTGVPGKGRLLTAMARRWFGFIEERGLARTHVVGWGVDDLASRGALGEADRQMLRGRLCVGCRARVMPVECVVRGYLDGSGWREYEATGAVCGVRLPAGLRRGDRLAEPIFTPATKAEDGAHDENISFDEAAALVGGEAMEFARSASLAVYKAAAHHAETRGLLLADTKFEFGWPMGEAADGSGDASDLVLIDEVLTPDSTRYWPADGWSPGGAQPSFDKQFVREHLQGLVDRGAWDKSADEEGFGPALPEDVVAGTVSRYREVLERLWGTAEC